MHRETFANSNLKWDIKEPVTWEKVQVVLLMDIRAELRRIADILGCSSFTRIPHLLYDIEKNTRKPKRKKVKK